MTFYYLYDQHLEPKYNVFIPMDVTRALRSQTRSLLDEFWAQSYNFDDPWTEDKLPKLLTAFTQVSALITSFANYVERYDNRWTNETYESMHALATDNLNLAFVVAASWQKNRLGDPASQLFQKKMYEITSEQARIIRFKPENDAHLATAIGNGVNFSDTLRTSYYYFMEMGDFTEQEFDQFQGDVSYAVMAAANTISMINDGNEDINILFGSAYKHFNHEYNHSEMAKYLIKF